MGGGGGGGGGGGAAFCDFSALLLHLSMKNEDYCLARANKINGLSALMQYTQ